MSKKIVIFDLDGTLIDSLKDLKEAVNFALNKLNFEIHPLSSYEKFIGNGVNKLLKRAMPKEFKDDENVFIELKNIFLKYYDENLVVHTKPYDGIYDVLKYYKNRDIKLAVASNKYHKATVKIVNTLFADFDFEFVFGQRDSVPTKPNPAVINEIITLSKVDKSEVLFIGDSLVDVETGNNANVDVCAVTWGYEDREKLLSSNATFFAEEVGDLLKLIT